MPNTMPDIKYDHEITFGEINRQQICVESLYVPGTVRGTRDTAFSRREYQPLGTNVF